MKASTFVVVASASILVAHSIPTVERWAQYELEFAGPSDAETANPFLVSLITEL